MGDFLPFLVVTPQLGWCTAWLAHSCPPIRLYSFQRRIQVAAEARGFVVLRFQVPTSSEICPCWVDSELAREKPRACEHCLFVALHICILRDDLCACHVNECQIQGQSVVSMQMSNQYQFTTGLAPFFPHSKCSVALAIACVFASARCPC